jgi:hypothetical protein
MNATLLLSKPTPNKPAVLKTIVALLILVTGFVSESSAQSVSTYQLDQLQITPSFALLPAGKTPLFATSGNIDNGVANATIPFTFNYGGVNFTSTNISLNGFLTFGATAPATTEVTPISSATAYGGAVSAYGWDLDLVPASVTNNVSYYTAGSSPNRIFKIEWSVKRSSNVGTPAQTDTNSMVFQVWLYETTNVIEMHYNQFNPSSITTYQGQIGLRGSSNADYKNLNYSTVANWPALPSTMAVGSANNNTVVTRGTSGQIQAASNRLFRWTPVSCFAPSGLTATLVTSNSAMPTWIAPSPAPSNGYQYEVRTSGAAGSGATGLVASGSTASLSQAISGLSASTLYCVYVRSDCGGSYSSWTTSTCFTTLCTAANIPYTGMYFDPFDTDGFSVPALPTCTSIQNVGTGNNWVTDATSEEGWMDEHLMYNASGSQAANVWFFTKGVNLVAGNTYRLSYEYGGSTNFSFITNQMAVAYGTAPAAVSMTTQLADHTNIKASPIANVINFTAPSTGVFYFGFRAHSAANMGRLFLDTIEIVNSICIRPTGVTVSAVTYSSATVNWTIPTPVPASGYAYYLSTSSTPPASTTTPTGFIAAGTNVVNLTGLSGNTTYYFWVRGNCGSPDDSEWSTVQSFLTLATPPYCIPPVPASATTSPINNVTTTNAITNINNSSGYTAGYGDYTSLVVTESQGGSLNFSVDFQASGGVGIAIWVDWDGDGVFSAAERMYNTTGYQFTSPVSGSFTVPAGAPLGVTRMRVMADYWQSNPSNPCTWGTSGATRGEIEDYSFKVVTPPPALTVSSASSTQCAGSSSTLVTITTPLSNFDTYSWSPSTGVTGNAASGYTFTSATTITYTLTGTQTSGSFSVNTATFTFNANPLPTPITITPTPSSSTACQNGSAVQLIASGGVVSGVPILTESFNTGATGWTSDNSGSTGGPVANSAWSLRPDGYVPTGPSWFGTVLHSNDNTTMFFSDADSQGSGNYNDNKLISPVFSLSGYTAASLSFWHYYKSWTPSNGAVQISTDGGTTWASLQGYTNTTQGTPTVWSHVVLDLGAYVGQTNLRLRWYYTATWGWGWGVDNVLVSGSATSAITWTPATGLWNDAAMTSPYVAGTGTITVYALPSGNTTYTASASTPNPTVCSTTTQTNVFITPIVAGTASSDQNVCGGTVADLTLAGYSGTIVGWEYASDFAFTVGVTSIPASASTTLTAAQIGTLTATRYYRAKITNGTCTAYSNVITLTLTSTTWNGSAWSNGTPNATKAAIFAGNYSSTGSVNSCSVVVNSGNVVFNSGHTLICQNTVTVNGGTLTFNNNASLNQTNNASVNVGNIIYKRATPMKRFDYTYWSAPVYPQTLANFSPTTLSDKYWWWNPTVYNWENVAAPGITNMVAGRGYIIRAPEGWPTTLTTWNGVFTGVPNNGTITMPIVVSGANNLNLLGNPYPSAINADLLLSTTGPNAGILGGTIYLWTHNTMINPTQYTQSDYAVYNLVGGVGTGTAGGGTGNTAVPNGKLASGQGFFVKGLASGTATFNNSMRVNGNNSQFFRTNSDDDQHTEGEIEKHRVWLEIKNNQGAYKQMLVGYVETATNGKDISFDGDAVDGGNVVGLYSVLGADKLTIQGRALPFTTNDQVPLGYKAAIAGSYEIALSDFDGLFTEQDVYLEDTMLNVIHDLKSASYTFSTTAGTFDTRFILRYTDGASLGVVTPTFNSNSVVVYKDDAGIHISTGTIQMESVTIFDIRGREIFNTNGVNSTMTTVAGLNAAQQVLLVQIKSNDNRIVTKKIVY